MPVAVALPDVATPVAVTAQTAATNTQQSSGRIQSLIQKIRSWVEAKRQWIQDKIDENRWRILKIQKAAFMFANFMRTMFQFFVIIILARMVVGFFSKPLEFIMLGLSCIILAVVYVIYYIFYIPPFIWIPFLIWFLIFDIIPLILFTVVMLALFIVITIFCLILGILNWATNGALKSLVLCENHVAAWYKTPNFHLTNKYERGFLCSKQCLTGYYPDATGMSCVRVPKGSPSYCPQAEVMRMYTSNTSDRVYTFKDYQINGNLKYLSSSPLDRELLIKKHFLSKRLFLEKCDKEMKKYNYMPLGLCSSIDVMDKNDISPKLINKMKAVCSQAFCNSKTNYPVCSLLSGTGEDDDSEFWKKVMKILISIIAFMVVISFTIGYVAGVPID